jgi:hypothetical protein
MLHLERIQSSRHVKLTNANGYITSAEQIHTPTQCTLCTSNLMDELGFIVPIYFVDTINTL